jgi:hypothetical protein
LSQQVFSAFRRAPERILGLGFAIKAKKTKNAPGATADHIELPVGRDKIVGEKLGRYTCIGQQFFAAEQPRGYSQGVNDRAEAGCAADSQQPCDAGRVPAMKILAKVGDRSQRELA